MRDRELLELAAKSVGRFFDFWTDKITDSDSDHHGEAALYKAGVGGQCHSWNPLIDDYQALQLAVDLRLDILQGALNVQVRKSFQVSGKFNQRTHVDVESDRMSATRRAIVIAAAGIGRDMP